MSNHYLQIYVTTQIFYSHKSWFKIAVSLHLIFCDQVFVSVISRLTHFLHTTKLWILLKPSNVFSKYNTINNTLRSWFWPKTIFIRNNWCMIPLNLTNNSWSNAMEQTITTELCSRLKGCAKAREFGKNSEFMEKSMITSSCRMTAGSAISNKRKTRAAVFCSKSSLQY
jgi:hypothetical protein